MLTMNKAVTTLAAILAPVLVTGSTSPTGHYASVNGLNMYYEIHGTGRPLVLLHGGMTTIDTSFGKLLLSFSEARQVIAIEQQGHGHTADIDRPLTFDQMSDDTATLLRQLKIDRADFLGYSLGGIIGLDIAIRHPHLVNKVIVLTTMASHRKYAMPSGTRHSTRCLRL